LTAAQLLALGYPAPRGEAYVCVHLVERIWDLVGSGLDYARVRRLAEADDRPFASPAVTSWAALTSWSFQRRCGPVSHLIDFFPQLEASVLMFVFENLSAPEPYLADLSW